MVDTRRKKEEKIQQTTIYGNDALAFFPDKNSLLLKKKNKKTLFIIRSVNFDFEKQDFVLCSLITSYYKGPFLDIKQLYYKIWRSPHTLNIVKSCSFIVHLLLYILLISDESVLKF